MLAIAATALYTALRKRGTTRQLAGAIVASVIAALLLLPAQLWYNLRFNAEQAALSSLEIGLMLSYVALCGWILPTCTTLVYCLLTRPRDSNTAGRLPRQRKRTTRARAEAVTAQPSRRQPGVTAPYVYSADRPWGWLVYREGNFAGQELALKRSIISIGREEDNEVWLDDDTISRYHAELAWDKGQVYVTDNDSLNGVLLNGQRIRTSQLVRAGDELEIGAHSFVMKYAAQAAIEDDLDDDVLLPQLRRPNASRGGSGNSSPGNSTPEVKRPLAPTVALNHAQEQTRHPDQTELPQDDIATQETTKFAWTPLPPLNEPARLCIIISGEMAGHSFLLDRPFLTIGRDETNDIVFHDPSISRRHVQFSRQFDGDYVQDMASTHGTLLNDKPLQGAHILTPGDVITLGETRIEYTLLPEARTTPMPLSTPPTPFDFPPSMRLPSKFKG